MEGHWQLDADMQMTRPVYGNDNSFHHHSTHDDKRDIAAQYFMLPELYRAASTGDVVLFRQILEDPEFSHFTQHSTSPQGDTVLHVAAQFGHDELVRLILGRHDLARLIVTPNLFQNTPLHLAACAGRLSTVKILVSMAREISRQGVSFSFTSSNDVTLDGQAEATNLVRILLRSRNKENKIALHLALNNRSKDVARFLFQEDPESAHHASSESQTPLLMAAEAGYESLFEAMMRQPLGSEWPSANVVRRYKTRVVHAAILAKNKGILNLVLQDWPEVFSTNAQREIIHPIFVAVFIDYLEGVRSILIKFRDSSFFADINGFYPIHLAAAEGRLQILQEFLEHCPDSRELRNNESQNILHLAAKNGKAKIVSYILGNPELRMLINDKDCNGNTPLHLAAEGGHPKVVSIMTWDAQVDLKLLNGEGRTALDVAEKWFRMPTFRQLLTWQALRNVGVPRADDLLTLRTKLTDHLHLQRANRISVNTMSFDFYKDRTNTLMLMSTLIVTISFAAGLTSPGGHHSKPNPGMFHVFVVTNTIALYSSTTAVVVALIWAQFSDREIVLIYYNYILRVLGLALAMVSIAFLSGAYLVASEVSIPLAYFVLVIGAISFLTFFILFGPLLFLNSTQPRFMRYLLYYPFHLLIKVAESDDSELLGIQKF